MSEKDYHTTHAICLPMDILAAGATLFDPKQSNTRFVALAGQATLGDVLLAMSYCRLEGGSDKPVTLSDIFRVYNDRCPNSQLSKDYRKHVKEFLAELTPKEVPKVSQINGACGEATMDDDMPVSKAVRQANAAYGAKRAQRKSPNKALDEPKPHQGPRKLPGQKKKSIVRRAKDAAKKGVVAAGSAIHPVVGEYLDRLMNPHARQAAKRGIPSNPSGSSQKARAVIDVTMSTGTMGVGFISINPSTVSDQVSVSYSSAAYAGTTIPAMNAAVTGQVTATMTGLPYAAGQLGNPALKARIVCMGVEVESTTAVLYEQGIIQKFVEPEHGDISNYGAANLTARQECVTKHVVKGETHHLSVFPVLATDKDYTTNGWYYTNNVAQTIAGFLVTGASTTNQDTFLCRVTVDVEYIGTTAESASTQNDIAPPGSFEICSEVASRVHAHHASEPMLSAKKMAKIARNAYALLTSKTARNVLSLVPGTSSLFL